LLKSGRDLWVVYSVVLEWLSARPVVKVLLVRRSADEDVERTCLWVMEVVRRKCPNKGPISPEESQVEEMM
jgi:hypothetical protein